MHKKSQAFVVLIFLIGMIIIGLTISILMKPMKAVHDETYQNEAVQDEVYQQFYTRTQTMWVWLPMIIGLGMVMWTLIKAHERSQYG